jgi:hypothetical protein
VRSKTQMSDQMTNKANRSLIKRNVENLIAIILSGGVKKFECVTEIFAGKVAAHTQKEATTFCGRAAREIERWEVAAALARFAKERRARSTQTGVNARNTPEFDFQIKADLI